MLLQHFNDRAFIWLHTARIIQIQNHTLRSGVATVTVKVKYRQNKKYQNTT